MREYLLNKGFKFFKNIFAYDTIDSTNKEAKRKAVIEGITSALIISDEQTEGIGRRGRPWKSEKDTGIYMSLLLKPEIKPHNASLLTLLSGLSVLRGIYNYTGLECKIKWPNDLVIQKKKVCGILTQMSSENNYINYVIIGIGINVNNEIFPKDIDDIGTSLKKISEIHYDRKKLIGEIIKEFENLYSKFLDDESLEFILNDFNKVCININNYVKIEKGEDFIIGKALEVNKEGNLIILLDNGEKITINSGEVSIRGLYGYV